MKKFKKFIIFLLVFLTIFSFLGLKETKKAEAIFCSNCSTWAGDILHFAQTVLRWLKEDLMKALRDVIAKRIMDYIVDQTVKWIQGGGKPQFVSDWKGFLRNSAKIAEDSFIKELGLSPLCSPFKLQVKLALLPVERFSQQIDCTLDDIVKNLEDFYADFTKGGWIAYREAWFPNNNFFGVTLMSHDKMLEVINENREAAKNEVMAGQGWISVKKNYGGRPLDSLSDEEFNNLNLTEDQYDLLKQYEEEGKSLDDLTDEEFDALSLDNDQYQKLSEMKFGEPPDEKIITPGQAVGEVVADALTSDSGWARNIQSWLSALVNALINRLIKEGLSMMQGSDSSSEVYRPSEYNDVVNGEIEEQKQQMRSEVLKYVNEWLYLADAKVDALETARSLSPVLKEIEQLGNCQTTYTDPVTFETRQLSTSAEIDNLIIQLSGEIEDLETKIQEGNTMLDRIDQLSSDPNAIAENTKIYQEYSDFINKYNTVEFQQQILDGSARKAADDEKKKLQNELQAAQNILNSCRPVE